MKFNITFLISFFTLLNLQSQDLIWYKEVHHENIQLRLPLSTVLGQLDLDLPYNGKVLVRFDGYCKSSPGDRIIVAASNIDKWDTNERNLGLYAYNADNNSQSFSHQRIYNINAGKQSFYAIGHNFVDLDGSGIASIHGTLTVEYFPTTSSLQTFSGKGVLKYPVELNGEAQMISSEKIDVPSKGKVLVTVSSSVYSLSNNEIEIALNNTEKWPLKDITSKINIVNTYATRYTNISKIFDVEVGNHEFFMLARKNKGDLTNSNNAFYANMTVQFFPDEEEKNILIYDLIESGKIHTNTSLSTLGKVTFDAPESGQVILNAAGKFNMNSQKTVWFKITDQPIAVISNPDLKVQKLHAEHGEEFLSATKVFKVVKGKNEFYFYGAFENSNSAFNEGTFSGNFTLKYVSDPKISSINLQELNKTDYTFFPNPTSNIVYVKINGSTIEKRYDVFIYDLNGNEVKKLTDTSQNLIELSDLPDGTYILNVVFEEHMISEKIIKKN